MVGRVHCATPDGKRLCGSLQAEGAVFGPNESINCEECLMRLKYGADPEFDNRLVYADWLEENGRESDAKAQRVIALIESGELDANIAELHATALSRRISQAVRNTNTQGRIPVGMPMYLGSDGKPQGPLFWRTVGAITPNESRVAYGNGDDVQHH